MRVKSRTKKNKFTGSYQYSFTLTKDVEAEWAMIQHLEELPTRRRAEFIRQRFMNSGSSAQLSSMGGFSLPSEGERANKVNVKNILRDADEEI